jgi:signal recognition particle GTPase
MGTSSMYKGRNKSPLLPSDFDDGGGASGSSVLPDAENGTPDDNTNSGEKDSAEQQNTGNQSAQNQPQQTSWQNAKTAMSKYASGGGGTRGKSGAVSYYVKGYGGARNAARTAKAGIRTTINIGNFFGGVLSKGISQVLNEYNIQTEGRSPKQILNDIVNVLAPNPDTNDDSVARKALIRTMSVIYEKFDDEKQDISLLDSLDSNMSELLVSKYIETFIYERLINDVGSRIESKAENSNQVLKIEKELKEYIESKVSTTLKDKPLSSINANAKNVYSLVEELYHQCYKVLEDQL